MVDHLTEKLKSKDKKAFKELIMLIQKPLYAFLLPILKDRELINDIMQTTFLKVYERISQFSGQSSLKTWIFTIARNESFNSIKSSKAVLRESLDDSQINTTADSPDNSLLFRADFSEAIERGMELLSPVQKKVFLLRRIECLSTKQTSERMRCSEAHVKKQLYLAMDRIRKFFKKNYSISEKWYIKD